MGLFKDRSGGGRADFSDSQLPSTRVELFFSVVKAHWAQLIGLNMLYFVSYLPMAAWLFVNLNYLLNKLEEDMTPARFLAHFTICLAGNIPLIALTAPVTAGMTYVLRNWARDEHAFVFSDMWGAMKANWKQALGAGFLSGLFPFVTFTAVSCYAVLVNTHGVLLVIPIVFVCLGQLLWLLMLEPMYLLMVTYDLSFRDLLKDSLFLSVASAGKAILVRLITAAVPVACLVLTYLNTQLLVYTLFVLLVYYSLFGLCVTRLAFASYGNMLCDKYINPSLGEPVRRGLRPEDDTVYRPEDDED